MVANLENDELSLEFKSCMSVPYLPFQVNLHNQTRIDDINIVCPVLVLQVHAERELCQVDVHVDV